MLCHGLTSNDVNPGVPPFRNWIPAANQRSATQASDRLFHIQPLRQGCLTGKCVFHIVAMPATDVAIDVVGKYCYDLHSPHDDKRAPVIVDVVLVGRTKILKIHSAMYVHNATLLRMGFRLHMPTPTLARQIMLAPGDQVLTGDQDIRLKPLKPGEGEPGCCVLHVGANPQASGPGSVVASQAGRRMRACCTELTTGHRLSQLLDRVVWVRA